MFATCDIFHNERGKVREREREKDRKREKNK